MKRLALIFILAHFLLSAQQHQGTYKNHLTFNDTFFGNEEAYQVCYPKEHRTFFYSIFFASGIAFMFFCIIIYQKTKHNKALRSSNDVISEKNRSILDSIHYAKRIQTAILPNQNDLKGLANSLSVLYCPRDIVSGDLYWVHKSKEDIYLAVIDCTGHGVPGAFLSLLAHNAIEQAIIEKGLKGPREILDSMNDFVKSVLDQNNEEGSKDGMEIGLCLIQKTSIKYSGANISLKYISNGKLNEIKAAKCTVGSVQANVIEPPIEHFLELKKGDRILMHSDGIIDQFGGPKNRKITSKVLNELIQKTIGKNSAEQLSSIKDFFMNWKGNNEQTDDVLMLLYEI
ncbi:MAG: SpoIIE family protein phosphatase [Bacteroidia bacterium]|nr:SpoIIE family protein phosphatase [Sphingobacteriaceae bacterium]MBP9068634.1 SpoIIE family protein phosphatase [Bacteroidia bacterium]